MEKNPYLRLVAAVLFAAVCAYVGAALYPRLRPEETVTASAVQPTNCIRLEGIALRDEAALSLPEGDALFARDGERLGGKTVLAAVNAAGGTGFGGSAVFIAGSDGLEELSVADALPLSAETVRALMEKEARSISGQARLVRGFDWYYAAVSDYDGELPRSGCTLRFEGFEDTVPARLVDISDSDSGERALLFRLLTGDTRYLKLRNCGAELVLPG